MIWISFQTISSILSFFRTHKYPCNTAHATDKNVLLNDLLFSQPFVYLIFYSGVARVKINVSRGSEGLQPI